MNDTLGALRLEEGVGFRATPKAASQRPSRGMTLGGVMPFQSQAQRRKLLNSSWRERFNETFEEWNRETGGKKLPERVKRKSAPSRKKAAGRTKRKSAPRSKAR